jgi:hypothetical protein
MDFDGLLLVAWCSNVMRHPQRQSCQIDKGQALMWVRDAERWGCIPTRSVVTIDDRLAW